MVLKSSFENLLFNKAIDRKGSSYRFGNLFHVA